jgi:hypothetical protein
VHEKDFGFVNECDEAAHVGMPLVQRVQEIEQSLTVWTGLGHIRCASRASDETVQIKALKVRKHDSVHGCEQPAIRDDGGIEWHALGLYLTADVDNRLPVASREGIGPAAPIPHNREAASGFENARKFAERLRAVKPVKGLGTEDQVETL